LSFFIIYFTYLVLVMEPAQWLVIWPLVKLVPSRRPAIVRAWMRLQARWVLSLARWVAGMRLTVEGTIPPTSCIVVMNHQSLLDIPLGVAMIRGPYPLIPTRASYRHGIPGISTLTRLMRTPFVNQAPEARRAAIQTLTAAAGEVAEGKQSLLIYPEGHRSRDGEILPFMGAGLRHILARASDRPLYAIVADGLWPVRTFSDIAFRLAGSSVRAVALGPYTIPREHEKLPDFIEGVRGQMIATLADLRAPAPAPSALATRPELAG
jgi:1-acyl-sn-glycerol-3-phosphate acyltransferase